MNKKDIRRFFREAVFERDNYTCQVCGTKWSKEAANPDFHLLNAHHITDRSLMPNGGYVPENGVTVCEGPCHRKVEAFHETGVAEPGFSPDDLYLRIGTCREKAVCRSKDLM